MSDSGNVWCVKPEDVTIDLQYRYFQQPVLTVVAGDGAAPDLEMVRSFWIKVKKYLTVGEERRIMTAGWRSMSTQKVRDSEERSTEIQIDWRAQTFARTEAYLLDWSLTKDGVPLTRDGIESLEPAVYGLIEDAITAHKASMDAAKKATPGG